MAMMMTTAVIVKMKSMMAMNMKVNTTMMKLINMPKKMMTTKKERGVFNLCFLSALPHL